MTDQGKIPVLFIAGMGRSGSTLIANILGQTEDYVATGELQHIWERSFVRNNPCGCNRLFFSCPFWRSVIEKGFPETDVGQYARLSAIHKDQTRTLRMYTLHGHGKLKNSSPALQEFAAALWNLYHAIYETTGHRSIVDSSKNPMYAAVLDSIPGIDLYLLHLIRDVRGVAYSRFLRKYQTAVSPRTPFHLRHLLESSILWNSWNSSAEALGARRPERYMRIRYEDFLTAPQESLSGVLELFRLPATHLPFVSDAVVELHTNHLISGNDNRFISGKIPLIPDNRWKTALSPFASRFLLASSLPWMARYGYLDRLNRRNAS